MGGGREINVSSALVLSWSRQMESQRNRERGEEERQKIPLASVPFSLSGAGNLPRDVTESINSFLPLITCDHRITAMSALLNPKELHTHKRCNSICLNQMTNKEHIPSFQRCVRIVNSINQKKMADYLLPSRDVRSLDADLNDFECLSLFKEGVNTFGVYSN